MGRSGQDGNSRNYLIRLRVEGTTRGPCDEAGETGAPQGYSCHEERFKGERGFELV